MNEHIAIIEDDNGVRFFLEEALKGEQYRVSSFESYEDAALHITHGVDAVIMDISLPGMDGLSAIDEIKRKSDVPVIIITANGTKKNAMEAVERGAADFFVKPVPLDELKIMVKRVLKKKGLRDEIEEAKKKTLSEDSFYGVLGKSSQMKEIFRIIGKIAGKDISVLITGETGVGKEVVAGLIHNLSGRKGDLVIVNCASIPDNLLESELFGYEKGAFTGAYQQKQGKFELADRGTLVLDEIGEMSSYLQAKLLRVIETQEIERLGSVKKHKVNVRILATTNRVLETEMKKGGFREDLYHRLAQMHINVPPLRERNEDKEVLINGFLIGLSKTQDQPFKIDPSALSLLINYGWPGNVRELINVIKRASVMCEGNTITTDDLPLYLKGHYSMEKVYLSDKTLDDAVSEFEKKMIIDALLKTNNQQASAAKLLGISERSIWYRIKKYDIDVSPDGYLQKM